MSAGWQNPPRQLPLTLPHRAAMSRADFLTGAGNRAAIGLIDRWPEWPERGVILTGPTGSGKSHLVEIWRRLSGARVASASAIGAVDGEALLSKRALAVEDLHDGPIDEAALFHLLNLAFERKAAMLVTSRERAAGLSVRLTDLASRLRALQPVELQEPDDDLLRRVLTKLFADRQLAVDPAVVDFITVRTERSLQAANALVERLDHDALARGLAVSKRLAGLAIAELFDRQPDLWPDER